MKTFSTSLGTLILLALIIQQKVEAKEATTQDADKVIQSSTVTGQLVEFSSGDYLHVGILTTTKKQRWFFVDNECLKYFLPLHRDQLSVVHYRLIDRYIPEAGRRETVEAAYDATINGLSCSTWWSEARDRPAPKELHGGYEYLFKNSLRP